MADHAANVLDDAGLDTVGRFIQDHLSDRRWQGTGAVSALNGSLRLTQLQLAELFGLTVPDINIPLRKIVQEGELAAEAVIKRDLIPACDGKRYPTKVYRLDMC